MTRREQRSLIVLAGLAIVGHLLRALLLSPGKATGAIDLFDRASDGNPRAQQQLVQHLMRPLGASERVDADRATADEFQRLPGIGHTLAARIVADRESKGPFGNLARLARVAGMGEATRAKLAPHLQFSGVPADTSHTLTSMGQVDLNRATVPELDALPGIGPARARAIVAFRDSVGPFRQIEDLLHIPGMTRGLIAKIAPHVVLQ